MGLKYCCMYGKHTDQMPHSAASDLGLHCLQWPIYPNAQGYYGIHEIVEIKYVYAVDTH